MIRYHVRVWVSGPGLPAAGGLAAFAVATALLALAASIRTGIPIENITATMLLPLALGGSFVTTLVLPPRPRPAGRRRVVAVPVEAPTRVPGTRVPAPPGWAGTRPTPGRHFPAGRAKSPAAVGSPLPGDAAAGPTALAGAA